jgi:hypothetical protein
MGTLEILGGIVHPPKLFYHHAHRYIVTKFESTPPVRRNMDIYQTAPMSNAKVATRFINLVLQKEDYKPDSPNNSTLCMTLDTCVLQDAPKYEALSYVWGKEEKQTSLNINGNPFLVQSNLHAALRRLSCRSNNAQESTRRLWIDAICINQNDNAEKSLQVMQMSKIYAGASNVLIWLGEADASSHLAFDTLCQFANDNARDVRKTCDNLASSASNRRTALQEFFQRPYFKRAWIIQEVVAAKQATVICGGQSISFDKMFNALEMITGSGFFPYSPATAAVTDLGLWREEYLREDSRERDEWLDLHFLLMYTRNKSCMNPRDSVYSIRGLASDSLSKGIVVDYDQPTEQVFIECAKNSLRKRPNDLRILSTVELRHRDTSSLRLPSWVPDWTQPNCDTGVLQRYSRFSPDKYFRSAAHTKPRIVISEDSDKISLQGRLIDHVTMVIPIKSLLERGEGNKHTVTKATITQIVDTLDVQETYPYTGESYCKAFLRTITADRTVLSPRVSNDYRMKFFSSSSEWKIAYDEQSCDLPDLVWEEISNTIWSIIEDKMMFITAKGYLGMGREVMEIGDWLCVFLGAETPFLLREASYQHEFNFLGECYVHGIMDGEVMSTVDEHATEAFTLV